MTATTAFQIEVTNSATPHRRVYFVGADTEQAALERLAEMKPMTADERMRIVRALNSAAIQEFKIGRGSIFQWI